MSGSEPPRGDGPADAYAAKYMGAGRALALTRKAMPWWYHLVFALPMLVEVVAAIATGIWALLAIVPVLLFMWIMFTHARVAVTTEHVQVQLGLFGPKIPIAAIEHVAPEKYDSWKYGGYGIKYAHGTWAYSVGGGNGMGVRIEYRLPDGKKKAVFASTNEPEAIVGAIERARAGKGVRVDAPAAAPHLGEELEGSGEDDGEKKATGRS